MTTKFHQHLTKHYPKYSLLANALIALGFAGMALLGVLNSVLTAAALIAWGILVASLYAIGKLLDQEVEDLDKVKAHADENK